MYVNVCSKTVKAKGMDGSRLKHLYQFNLLIIILKIHVIRSCNMGTRDLPDMYARIPTFPFDPPTQSGTYIFIYYNSIISLQQDVYSIACYHDVCLLFDTVSITQGCIKIILFVLK